MKSDLDSFRELKHAYHIAANIVAMYGDVYLPLFKRLHAEIKSLQQEMAIKNLALELASDNMI